MKRIVTRQKTALRILASLKGNGSRDDELRTALSEDEFASLEKDYGTVLEDMLFTPMAKRFVEDFKRLWLAMAGAHANECRLIERVKEQKESLVESGAKLSTEMRLNHASQEAIGSLQQEIEEAWRKVDAAHAREQTAQEKIENLRQQISRLNLELEQKTKLCLEQDGEYSSMVKNKEAQAREKERTMSELASVKVKLAQMLLVKDDFERKNALAELKINELTQELQNQQTELLRESRFKLRSEEDLKNVNAELDKKKTELLGLRLQLHMVQKANTKLENKIKELKASSDRIAQNNENLSQRLLKLQDDHTLKLASLDQSSQRINSLTTKLTAKEEEVAKLKSAIGRVAKTQETHIKRAQLANLAKTKADEVCENLKKEKMTMLKDMDSLRNTVEVSERETGNHKREIELLNKKLTRAAELAVDQKRVYKIQDKARDNLEVEIEVQAKEMHKQKAQLEAVEKDKDKYMKETAQLSLKLAEGTEESRQRRIELCDCKQQLTVAEARLREEQDLFEAMRTDKKLFAKNLLDAQDEIASFKQKIKVLMHQIEQMKEDISSKEKQLIRYQLAERKQQGENEMLRADLQKCREDLSVCRHNVEKLVGEQRDLELAIMEADRHLGQTKKELQSMTNERDSLSCQLTRRNDDLKQLGDKANFLQATLDNGESQYNQRLEDIRLLKLEVKKLRSEKLTLTRSVANMADLRQEIYHLEQDLTQERLKVCALEEELQNPLNIHRWRKLEGSDPTAHELLQKVTVLQKRLLNQSSVVLDKDNQLKDCERIYNNLKKILARLKDPDIAVKVHKSQYALRERDRRMKCLVAELTMCEAQMSESKFDLDRTNQKLVEMKMKYFKEKRGADKLKQKLAAETGNSVHPSPVLSPLGKPQFTGGGFNKTNPQPRELVK